MRAARLAVDKEWKKFRDLQTQDEKKGGSKAAVVREAKNGTRLSISRPSCISETATHQYFSHRWHLSTQSGIKKKHVLTVACLRSWAINSSFRLLLEDDSLVPQLREIQAEMLSELTVCVECVVRRCLSYFERKLSKPHTITSKLVRSHVFVLRVNAALFRQGVFIVF